MDASGGLAVVHAPFPITGRTVVLLAEGCFSPLGSKTAACFLRYRRHQVVAVLDSTKAGMRAVDAIGFGGDVPVVGTLEKALPFGPEVALLGVAPRGGVLDERFKKIVIECLERGLDVISGLHQFLEEDEDIRAVLARSGAHVWDVRRSPETRLVASGKGCTTGARTVFIAGTDCNVGKMTCAYECAAAAERRGIRAGWAATGQTGIILRERGIAVDRVIGDFIGGAAEALVNLEGTDKDLVFVEGQGSIFHPGYAGVAMGLLFGVMPDDIIMCHEAGRTAVRGYDAAIPPMKEVIDLHERLFRHARRVRVSGIALNTMSLDAADARRAVGDLEDETGLPVTDPIRFGCDALIDAVTQPRRENGGGA
jgi:uncharacterized NAD-dependent epimerase/dehydratase family protein